MLGLTVGFMLERLPGTGIALKPPESRLAHHPAPLPFPVHRGRSLREGSRCSLRGLSPTEVHWLCLTCCVTSGTLPNSRLSLQRQGVLLLGVTCKVTCGEEQCLQAVGGGGVEPREEGTGFSLGGLRSGLQTGHHLTDVLPWVLSQSKNNRPLRTGQMYAQDENATHTQLYTSHFDLMKMTAGKRSPPIKPLYAPCVLTAPAPRRAGAGMPACACRSCCLLWQLFLVW